MKPQHYKPIRKGKPKRKGKISRSKSQMRRVTQEWKSINSPQLRETYSTKIEWAKKLISKKKEKPESSKKEPVKELAKEEIVKEEPEKQSL